MSALLSLLASVTWSFDGYGHMMVFTWDTVFLHPMYGQVVQWGLLS